jgi:uncharacterized protein YggU (UPF0235/DUF167 family)
MGTVPIVGVKPAVKPAAKPAAKTIRVKVVPRSAASGLAGEMADGTLKVRIVAAPERGRANAELCRVLARHYSVAPGAVTIVSGHTSALKLVRIDG